MPVVFLLLPGLISCNPGGQKFVAPIDFNAEIAIPFESDNHGSNRFIIQTFLQYREVERPGEEVR